MPTHCFSRRAAATPSLPDLLKAGASLNGEMTLIRTSNSDAISGAVRHAYLDVADTLVKLGAPVDRTDARITPLVKAVLGDQVEMAKFLISKGADVNHVDGNGMTPLLYAASIDFGSSAMIDMLLKAGARTDMKRRADGARARAPSAHAPDSQPRARPWRGSNRRWVRLWDRRSQPSGIARRSGTAAPELPPSVHFFCRGEQLLA
jgi:ankyrin repeat protein